ncbi:MAG: hypothetical protein EBU59_09775 [Planctomycetia bacterium]|jgi:hypothetical protein|nr:hypothetical protein [Planctomycetia bacterium]
MVSSASSSNEMAFGFLTVCDAAGVGTFGGYLLVDLSGRPLEFHCTAPVRVTRAQEILYGATLQRHLHGEQIGGPLLKATKLTPVAVLTDHESLLHARCHGQSPVAVVRQVADPAPVGTGTFELGRFHVQPHDDDLPQADQLQSQLTALAGSIELAEPFARIRAAIDEAQAHS